MAKKNYESPLQYFRDQKSGDFNPETGVIYDYPGKAFEQSAQYKDKVAAAERVGEVGKLEQLVSGVLAKLEGLELEDAYAGNVLEQKLLSEKVRYAKVLLKEVLAAANDYVDDIKAMGEVKLDADSEDFRERLKESDAERRYKHNALIDDINIFIRFVRNQFGQLPADQLERFQKQEATAKRPLPHVKRVE